MHTHHVPVFIHYTNTVLVSIILQLSAGYTARNCKPIEFSHVRTHGNIRQLVL